MNKAMEIGTMVIELVKKNMATPINGTELTGMVEIDSANEWVDYKLIISMENGCFTGAMYSEPEAGIARVYGIGETADLEYMLNEMLENY